MVGLKILPATNGSFNPKGIYMSRSDRSGTGRQANFYLYLYIYDNGLDGVVTPSVFGLFTWSYGVLGLDRALAGLRAGSFWFAACQLKVSGCGEENETYQQERPESDEPYVEAEVRTVFPVKDLRCMSVQCDMCQGSILLSLRKMVQQALAFDSRRTNARLRDKSFQGSGLEGVSHPYLSTCVANGKAVLIEDLITS